MDNIVTRFPPSPTGFMHIGNARTALFNWLYARHCGGKFLIRIEDTDRKRHSEEAVEVILKGLEWLGLDYDNEPVSQFANRQRHIEVAKQLLESGKAYYCYSTPEELEAMRAKAKEEGRKVFYDRSWRNKSPDEAPKGVKPVIRIKAPTSGRSVVNDAVQGEVSIDNENLDDFIILRSDGTPTYMLAVVVDDHDMGVTHVIRGDDHLNNSFRQNVIYEAMGWKIPVYAHMPLTHGADGAKFSKRHGSKSIDEYRQMGYLPEALVNYMLRLGWSHGDDEIIPIEKAIEWFDIKDINKAAGQFDFARLDSLNAHYIKEKDDEELVKLVIPFLEEKLGLKVDNEGKQRLVKGMGDLKERAKTLVELADEATFYVKKLPFEYDEKALGILDDEGKKAAKKLLAEFKKIPPDDFDSKRIEETCRTLAKTEFEGKLGKVMMPFRAMLTGTNKSPSLFHAAEVLGREEVIARLSAAVPA